MSKISLDKVVTDLTQIFQAAGLSDEEGKKVVREFANKNWGKRAPWSNLSNLNIDDVQKAVVGSGVVVTYMKDGVQKVVMAKAGAHYNRDGTKPAAYTIPGGFISLVKTEGSQLVPADDNKPESPRVGAAREVEEEFPSDVEGQPIIKVDPARLKSMDMDTISTPGGPLLVQGLMLELEPHEIEAFELHVARLESDPDYKEAVSNLTINPASGLPEVETVEIFDLDDVAGGKVNLLHSDQKTLFDLAHQYFEEKKIVLNREMLAGYSGFVQN